MLPARRSCFSILASLLLFALLPGPAPAQSDEDSTEDDGGTSLTIGYLDNEFDYLPGQQPSKSAGATGASGPMPIRGVSTDDQPDCSARDDRAAVDPVAQELGAVLTENQATNRHFRELGAGPSHAFIVYQFGESEEHSEGGIVGYGIKINFDKRYVVTERVRTKEKKVKKVKEREVEKKELDKKTFECLKTKVDAFVSISPPKRLPETTSSDVRIEGPARSLTLKVRMAPTEEQLVFRAHMGAGPDYYPDEFLDLSRKLDSILYSRL